MATSEARRILTRLGRPTSEAEFSKAIGVGLSNALELAPDVWKRGNETGSSFTSISLAAKLYNDRITSPSIASFLGIGRDTKKEIEVGMTSSPIMGSGIVLQAGRVSEIRVAIDAKNKISLLDFRQKDEHFAHVSGFNKQVLVAELLGCIEADLKSARRAWVQGNEDARNKFFEKVESAHGEDMLKDLKTVLDSLKSVSQGQDTLIDAMLGSTDYDRRDNNIPRDIKVFTTLPLDEEVAERFFGSVLPGSGGARGGFHVGYDFSTLVTEKGNVIESSPWMLYQRPDGKIIGVSHSKGVFSPFAERRSRMEASFKALLAGRQTGQKSTTDINFAILGYTGNFKNPPLGSEA